MCVTHSGSEISVRPHNEKKNSMDPNSSGSGVMELLVRSKLFVLGGFSMDPSCANIMPTFVSVHVIGYPKVMSKVLRSISRLSL